MWMDLEIIILSEVSQKEEDKYHTLLVTYIPHVTYMWNLKHDTNEFILQNRNRLTENKTVVAKGGGMDQEFGISKRKLLHIGWINNKILPYSTCVCVLSHFSCVRLCATLWTIACQAPLSMGFSKQEYWSGLPCPPPGDFLNPGIEPESLDVSCIDRYVLYHQRHLGSPHYIAQGAIFNIL